MPNNKPDSGLIKAAGAVAWRPGPDGEPEVLLVHRKKYDDWSLPKGKAESGEPLALTAVREVLEEAGARLALGRRLVPVRYNVGGRPKLVHYWAARAASVDERAVPNSEVDKVAWLPPARAVERLSYVHDHGVLADFAARPAGTVPLILLRHAKAVAKGDWKGSDAARPLDDSGRADAKALADLLACFCPRPRLVSSTAVRCLDTVRPLAQLTAGTVREEPSLYVHDQSSAAGSADPGDAVAALVRDAIASGEPSVISAHRENLPVLQQAALAVLGGRPASGTWASGTWASGTWASGTWASGTWASGTWASGTRASGAAMAEIPGGWDDELPTSGFWVLNVAPLPGPSEPDQTAAVRRPRSDGNGAACPVGDVPGGAARSGGDGPVGVLISADRYDLTES